ncbi:DUF397 domain-containing protein [Actinomadura macra]|uniref:DUF397 domain-containing protein n=1 Tax=Actinomadura macra TaxID=46164 RepID=UPI0008373789|nr:DUF397 domain-containing protein [Actinomadura macra]
MNVLDLSAVSWRKSSHSTDTGGECVEVANLAPVVAVRDSKDPDGPALGFSRSAFTAFVGAVREGSHDL